MAPRDQDERQPLTKPDDDHDHDPRASIDSSASLSSSASLNLALLDHAEKKKQKQKQTREKNNGSGSGKRKHEDSAYESQYRDDDDDDEDVEDVDGTEDLEGGAQKPSSRRFYIAFWIVVLFCVGGWTVAFVVFASSSRNTAAGVDGGDVDVVSGGNYSDEGGVGVLPGLAQLGEKIPLNQVLSGAWRANKHDISWIGGVGGEDGLLLEQNDGSKTGFLVVSDIRGRKADSKVRRSVKEPVVLMKQSTFSVDGRMVFPSELVPSPDLKSVLVLSDHEKRWRHSYSGTYSIFDVESQTGQALDPERPEGRVQLASWSPKSNAVVFTRGNNMFLRELTSQKVKKITADGGPDVFYGIPDWVYEEEVFEGNSATWWSGDGRFVAFLRTNETQVPEFPIEYYLSRPSGDVPRVGEDAYPDVVNIKYPKAGAPNPVVHVQLYDVQKGEKFVVDVPGDFDDRERLVTEVVWAEGGKVLVSETNRESDVLKMVLIDADARSGSVVREKDVMALDGGWVEMSKSTKFVPANPENGRLEDGYVALSINDGFNHIAYYSPVDNAQPVWLTSGEWEVIGSSIKLDLENGLVYFVGTKEAPTERHIYSVEFDGSKLQPVTDTSKPGYYSVSFSSSAGYGLLDYQGPGIPWQEIISTPSNNETYTETLEENAGLKKMAKKHALPLLVYSNVTIDGHVLQVVERRPPTFNPNKKYPVLFYLYGGPGSQTVNRKFTIDFQAYVSSSLEYIVVTVDGRGTGFTGRKTRCAVRDNLGYYEAMDQIETAKLWGEKKYVDASRMAIWGWSYGGFMTLKTLELDGGETFGYGMAVAPVTDWRFYGRTFADYLSSPRLTADKHRLHLHGTLHAHPTAQSRRIRFLRNI